MYNKTNFKKKLLLFFAPTLISLTAIGCYNNTDEISKASLRSISYPSGKQYVGTGYNLINNIFTEKNSQGFDQNNMDVQKNASDSTIASLNYNFISSSAELKNSVKTNLKISAEYDGIFASGSGSAELDMLNTTSFNSNTVYMLAIITYDGDTIFLNEPKLPSDKIEMFNNDREKFYNQYGHYFKKSVKLGARAYFMLTATSKDSKTTSMNDIKAALNAKFGNVSGSVSADHQTDTSTVLSNTNISFRGFANGTISAIQYGTTLPDFIEAVNTYSASLDKIIKKDKDDLRSISVEYEPYLSLFNYNASQAYIQWDDLKSKIEAIKSMDSDLDPSEYTNIYSTCIDQIAKCNDYVNITTNGLRSPDDSEKNKIYDLYRNIPVLIYSETISRNIFQNTYSVLFEKNTNVRKIELELQIGSQVTFEYGMLEIHAFKENNIVDPVASNVFYFPINSNQTVIWKLNPKTLMNRINFIGWNTDPFNLNSIKIYGSKNY